MENIEFDNIFNIVNFFEKSLAFIFKYDIMTAKDDCIRLEKILCLILRWYLCQISKTKETQKIAAQNLKL